MATTNLRHGALQRNAGASLREMSINLQQNAYQGPTPLTHAHATANLFPSAD